MATNSRIQAIERATNKPWDDWMAFMDSVGAHDLTHHEIATKVLEQLMGKIDNPGWWAQGVTVAYEQYIGRRIPGQRPDGTFQTSVSKATKLGMKELMDAWTNFAAKDKEVGATLAGDVRVSGTDKRISWRAKAKDGSTLIIISEPKSSGSASIVVQQMGLQTQALNEKAKATWTAIVGRFIKGLPS